VACYPPLVRAWCLFYFRLFYSSFFISSSGNFPVVFVVIVIVVVVTAAAAAAALVFFFTSSFSIYTFQPLNLHCFIAFFVTFINTTFVRIVNNQYIICGII